MGLTADALDAAAPDFVPVAKDHLIRPVLLGRRRSVADWGFRVGPSFGPYVQTPNGEDVNGFAGPYLRDAQNLILHANGPVHVNYAARTDAITVNYDATIESVLARTAELEASGAAYYTNVLHTDLATATGTLDAPAVSKLIRVVKNWDASTSTVDSQGDSLPIVLLNSEHRLLTQSFAWYRRWSLGALPAVLLGLKPAEVLRALRERRRELRTGAARVVSAPIRRLVGQLERLSHAIVPHAPPTGLLSQVRVPC